MKINFTKKQYKDLIITLGLGNHIVGILSDVMADSDYKDLHGKTSELEEYFLQFAKDFDCEDLIDKFEGRNVWDEDVYNDTIMGVMEDYGDYEVTSRLANKLAWRDFKKEHSDKEIKAMAKENSGYFGVALYDYEKKYWDEFEKHGFERLEINVKK